MVVTIVCRDTINCKDTIVLCNRALEEWVEIKDDDALSHFCHLRYWPNEEQQKDLSEEEDVEGGDEKIHNNRDNNERDLSEGKDVEVEERDEEIRNDLNNDEDDPSERKDVE